MDIYNVFGGQVAYIVNTSIWLDMAITYQMCRKKLPKFSYCSDKGVAKVILGWAIR
jgi:hypothetical protein